MNPSMIGWLAGTVFITVVRYLYKWFQDRRPFDLRYLATMLLTAIGVGGYDRITASSGEYWSDFAGGFGLACTVKVLLDIFTPTPPEVTTVKVH